MSAPPISYESAQTTIDVINECLAEGFGIASSGAKRTAAAEAAHRIGITQQTMGHRLRQIKRLYDMAPDPDAFAPRRNAFEVSGLPQDGDPSAEELIEVLKIRHQSRKALHDAAKLRQVQVNVDGPIAIAFFGDPHVDDPGCAWGDLERDVAICRDTEGVLAVDVGDDSNNWVGRLAKLYANQEVTSKQALVLIEWLMTQLPWLMRVVGNHDVWNTDKGDVGEYIHRITGALGIYDLSARMQLNLPSGHHAKVHVRHDFPGGSQFNPAHAMVRETLFGHRDHIMACGHRHTTGYIPIWHNDPERLCHGFRLGTYKDMDHYAKEKGFQEGNWARSMAAVIDPDYAHDPVRYIRPCFSLEEMAEYLTWRRSKWSANRVPNL